MASRSYRNLKFRYTSDFNEILIKNQRVYLDDNNQEITPITQLFLDRVINTNLKITGSSKFLRYINAYIGTRQLLLPILLYLESCYNLHLL